MYASLWIKGGAEQSEAEGSNLFAPQAHLHAKLN